MTRTNTAQYTNRTRTSKPIGFGLVLVGVLSVSASAQPLDFVTVGAAGNRGTLPSEMPWTPNRSIGSVPYEYQITRTEVTNDLWFEFANAFRPHYTGTFPGGARISGGYLIDTGSAYEMIPGSERYPVFPDWHNAARFCNWLHNGRARERWAFESGAYDTSTFVENPDGTRTDQLEHSPGARYWIPSLNELVKSIYYDPNRYGPGQDGYWLYPQSSNEVPVSGPPGVGTTNAGTGVFGPYGAAGSYPNITSPWGLLDTSGGSTEWTETVDGDLFRFRARLNTGSGTPPEFIPIFDRIDWGPSHTDPRDISGFRVVTAIPNVGTCSVLVVLGIVRHNRGRRHS